jgi:predicted O-linked N-acetylglucosamine transferase (SPINDLY family)
MGLTDTIGNSIDGYVSTAVRLGRDAEWRGAVRRRAEPICGVHR